MNSQIESRFQFTGVSHSQSGDKLGFLAEAEIWKAKFLCGWLEKAALFTSMIPAVIMEMPLYGKHMSSREGSEHLPTS